ncbi:hypothetical protein SEA_CEPENS_85 [Mycobacterium phage Cepens]|uniref:Uncharacterized protein n=1 Tax=Mycobacterium phage Taptic TaxID=1920305 RepID=A0A1J0MDW0_9CAUD|nr:hypothetical protein PQB71_gp79 [Mycobacterium phage Taptic]APD19312.1 hypothetical protein SEA_TAPTIC_86 [Mycobacterium phage Taptic]AVO21392.1 hypothetical protein PBI_MEGABEAR_83 [Mycobacterium phage Megabear]QBP31202.1 hypothetical protein SEA_ARGIE_86 [Mycobacterium phage Argie]QBP32745.1 hypothetical protein SEA_CEPENS_85 [Mycobacterium phage Cepens]
MSTTEKESEMSFRQMVAARALDKPWKPTEADHPVIDGTPRAAWVPTGEMIRRWCFTVDVLYDAPGATEYADECWRVIVDRAERLDAEAVAFVAARTEAEAVAQ